MEHIRILLAHRDTELARRLRAEIAANQSLVWEGAASSLAEILAACAERAPQIILLDTALRDASALEIIQAVTEAHSHIHIVGLSDSRNIRLIKDMLRNGASGYLLADKPLAHLLACLPAVLLGKTILSGELISPLLGSSTLST